MDELNVGDIVWGKLVGVPHWPCVILKDTKVPKPSKDPKIKYYWVYLFGSKMYSWIARRRLFAYESNRHKYGNEQKDANLVEAVKEADTHINAKKLDPNYEVIVKEAFNADQYEMKLIRGESRMKNRSKSINLPVRATRSTRRDEDSESKVKLDTIKIETSRFVFGVIGIGNLGADITRNLIHSGHKVNIWNRSIAKCQSLFEEFDPEIREKMTHYYTPRALVHNSHVIIICLSDKEAVRTIFTNCFGIHIPTDEVLKDKGIIQMTTTGPEFSKDMNAIIEKKGGKYLEAQIQRSKKETANGDFIILAAGDKEFFFRCHSFFKAIGNTVMFLGEVGYASKMNLILQMIKCVNLAALCEALDLAETTGVTLKRVCSILESTDIKSLYLLKKCGLIKQENFTDVEQSLTNLQRDMKLVMDLSDNSKYDMFIASVTNQVYENGIRLDYGALDASSIFLRPHH